MSSSFFEPAASPLQYQHWKIDFAYVDLKDMSQLFFSMRDVATFAKGLFHVRQGRNEFHAFFEFVDSLRYNLVKKLAYSGTRDGVTGIVPLRINSFSSRPLFVNALKNYSAHGPLSFGNLGDLDTTSFPNLSHLSKRKQSFPRPILPKLPTTTTAASASTPAPPPTNDGVCQTPIKKTKIDGEKPVGVVVAHSAEAFSSCAKNLLFGILDNKKTATTTTTTAAAVAAVTTTDSSTLSLASGVGEEDSEADNNDAAVVIVKEVKVIWSPWQKRLAELLISSATEKKIVVVVDPKGNCGKSFFANQYASLRPRSTVVSRKAKKGQLLYKAKQCKRRRAVFLDLDAPDQKELHYGALDGLLQGSFFSPNYTPSWEVGKPVRVVLFLREPPHFQALSPEKWFVMNLERKDGKDYRDVGWTESVLLPNFDQVPAHLD